VAFFLTDLNSPRVPLLIEYIERFSLPFGFRYFVVNWTLVNLTSPPSLAPPPSAQDFVRKAMTLGHWNHSRKGAELLAKFFFSLNFFLANTTAAWFWRGTDDVVINFQALPLFIAGLLARYDASREAVYAGNCIHGQSGPLNSPFMQGGAGYLMSRCACERLVPYAQTLMLESFFEEDQYLGQFLVNTLGVQPWDMTSSHFIGYHFTENEMVAIISGNYSALPKCPVITASPMDKQLCRRFLRPLKQIVFFHQSCLPFSNSTLELARAVFSAPVQLNWWVFNYMPQVCVNKSALEQ
jgi:hypothetical protein